MQQHLPLTFPALSNVRFMWEINSIEHRISDQYRKISKAKKSGKYKALAWKILTFLWHRLSWQVYLRHTHTHIWRAGLALTILTSPAKCVLSPYCEAYLRTCGFFHIIWWHFTQFNFCSLLLDPTFFFPCKHSTNGISFSILTLGSDSFLSSLHCRCTILPWCVKFEPPWLKGRDRGIELLRRQS